MNSGIALAVEICLAALLLLAIVVLFELRKTPKQEKELFAREDKAMSEAKDDPNEIPRWVP